MSVPKLRAKPDLPSEQLHPTVDAKLSVYRKTFPKTTIAFDWMQYAALRLEETVWQSKYLLFGLGFLLFLIYELAHFAKFLLKNWAG